jgi:hypothetical protein
MDLAPIVLFVYNRPEHTRRTVEALQKNDLAEESDLVIFSDNYKDEIDKNNVEDVRKYLKTIAEFKSVSIVERFENYGLAKSVISGVTEIVNKFGRVIVLEDDLITSPYFLKYMNEALDMYANEEKVISIHGYVYPIKGNLPETFFLRGADCWGWATWKRGWDLFEFDGQKLFDQLQAKKLTMVFDFEGSYPYTLMLKSQIKGFNSSWAVRWYASAFLADKLTLYPGKSLVQNIGFDKSGTHTGENSYFNVSIDGLKVNLQTIEIVEDVLARKIFIDYFLSFKMRLLKILIYLNYFKKIVKRHL